MSGSMAIWPGVVAFVVGWLVPGKRTLLERAAVALVALLSVAFIQGAWPGAGSGAGGVEWPHLLNVIVFLPLLAALAMLVLPRQAPGFLRGVTMSVLGVDFLLSLVLLGSSSAPGWHYQYVADWIPAFGIRYHVALDGLSFWLVLLTTLTTPIAALVTFGSVKERTKELCFSLLLLHGAMLGAFVSLDLFLFYVFWELMLIPMVILIGVWGGAERIKAAYKFFLFTMAGSVFMLAAILYLAWQHHALAGTWSFDYLALKRLVLPQTAAYLCFAGFALAFLIKVPMWPLHTWLPDAHVQAPTGGSIILAAVLLKLGTYAYIRFCMGMLAGPAYKLGATLAGVAVVGGILYGALVAWKQADVKKLIAYSSVAHLGFVMLGIFAATQAGLEGAILQMVNHGVTTGALFLLVGVIYDRRHTRMASEFGGLAKVMPVYAVLFLIVTMASIGVPGTNGFVGEFLVIMGTFGSSALGASAKLQAVGAALGVILAAVYMLSVVQKMFWGPVTNAKNAHLPDVNARELTAVAPLIALIFVIGWFPNLLLARMAPTVEAIQSQYLAGVQAFVRRPLVSGDEATLLPRSSGPLDAGYPEQAPVEAAPEPPAPVVAPAAAGDGEFPRLDRARVEQLQRLLREAEQRGDVPAPPQPETP